MPEVEITTKHAYVEMYPIDQSCSTLIIGTIHPNNPQSFKLPFFYGNVCSLWDILAKAFPQEFNFPLKLEGVGGILDFMARRNISLSDTIIETKYKNNIPSASDKNLLPIAFNFSLKEQIKNSNISKIFFTSGFDKNNAFKLFYETILGHKITKEIRENRGVTLAEEFGRPVDLIVLYSPSGSANIGITNSKLYKKCKHQYEGRPKPVAAFKIDYYREYFK